MNNIPSSLNRSSVKDAETVMSAVCPDAELRRAMLRCLLDSISIVEHVAPEAWAVTLFEDGFRLNVGQVEALTCDWIRWPFPAASAADGSFAVMDNDLPVLRILTQGGVPVEQDSEDTTLEISPSAYKSVALPQHVVSLRVETPEQLAYWYEELTGAHRRYLLQALHTPTGKVRSSTAFKRTHSSGLIDYARMFCSAAPNGQPTAVPSMDEPGRTEAREFYEGRPLSVQTTRYERDPNARGASLAQHGYSCAACGFNFGAVYGPVAEHYIQVHHLNPVSSHGAAVAINPITDMRPLCANCHAVAHFKNPPYTVEEIIYFIHKEQTS